MARRVLITALAAAALAAGASPLHAARDVTSLKQRVEAVEARAAALDAQAGAAAQRHNAAMDRADAVRAKAVRTRAEIARTRGQLVLARQALSERLVALYRRPEPDLVDLVAQSGSLTDLVTRSEALQAAAGDDADMVERVRARRVALRRQQVVLTRTIASARAEAAVASREAARIRTVLARQRALVSRARGELKAALSARAQERVRAARAKGAPGIPVAAPGVEPVFPVAAPATFSDDWMAPRGSRYHEGIDIVAARGAPIVAVVSGTVVRIGTTPISGKRFWLRAPNGDEYFYCHLDGFAPAAREGVFVRAGTVLGYNGDTGDARGTVTHLHFEIHPGGGGPIRPFPLVSSWPRVG